MARVARRDEADAKKQVRSPMDSRRKERNRKEQKKKNKRANPDIPVDWLAGTPQIAELPGLDSSSTCLPFLIIRYDPSGLPITRREGREGSG